MALKGTIQDGPLLEAATSTGKGSLIKAPEGLKTFYAEISGSGALSATVKIYGTRSGTKDDLHLVATLTLSGTGSAGDSLAGDESNWTEYYADLTAISGASASVDCGVLS